MLVVSDTSPLIALSRIGNLPLLQFLFETVLIPPAVEEEYQTALPSWVQIKQVNNQAMLLLSEHLHKGEAEAILLSY